MTRKRFKKLLMGTMNYSRNSAEEEINNNNGTYNYIYLKLKSEYDERYKTVKVYCNKCHEYYSIPLMNEIIFNNDISNKIVKRASIEAYKNAYKEYRNKILGELNG